MKKKRETTRTTDQLTNIPQQGLTLKDYAVIFDTVRNRISEIKISAMTSASVKKQNEKGEVKIVLDEVMYNEFLLDNVEYSDLMQVISHLDNMRVV